MIAQVPQRSAAANKIPARQNDLPRRVAVREQRFKMRKLGRAKINADD